MIEKEELIAIFLNIAEQEMENGIIPEIVKEDGCISYSFKEMHFIFINNVTLSFNKLIIDEDNVRFYIDDLAVSAIAIDNVDIIAN
ncbi:hypothetical protein [Methanobrevibacter cuticularis]|nr:hypothetical protein [Methanobrevibacter cuticularis]